MEYDALGRRIKKICNEKTNRYLWDGNVLLHEWDYQKEEEHETSVNDLGEVFLSQKEKVNNLVTWVYDTNNYNPSAKILGEEVYSIINDYLGTPVQAYNSNGKLIWERELDIYGKTRKIEGDQNLIPFLYQGQYYDHDIELAYNRFRYYNPETGTYISQDPIKHWGGSNLYSFVKDSNQCVDIFGWEDIWFRALNQNDMTSLNSGGNIIPKDPTATRTAYEHVLNGSTDGYADQYISLTKERSLAESWARSSGTEVAEIDLNKVQNNFLDLSTPEGREKWILNDKGAKFKNKQSAARMAEMMQEGLVEFSINNSAIKKTYIPCKS
ncbi:RHS repeat domain-containing protein [Flavobacterium columnare]|uniref:RHS repeat domain-containing protein n=1 Tax=Flavobacterium columnare TaxID=996 RepID=UPI002D79AF77|nr:RHS repeat-associated core domain-containing protein [Flavobacterium columnare]